MRVKTQRRMILPGTLFSDESLSRDGCNYATDGTSTAQHYGEPPDVLLPPDVLDEGANPDESANWKQRQPKKMA